MSKRTPVQDVYDLYRTARLNVKYLEASLKQLQRANFWIELVLGVSTSSMIAGLWLWESSLGGYVWKGISTIAAFLLVLKPILKLPKQLRDNEKLLVAYRAWDHDLYKLTVLIKQRQAYDAELQKEFLKALDRRGQLVKMDESSKKNDQLLEKCYQQVLVEIPVESLFVPED